MNILVTGVAGFIGYHLSKSLIDKYDANVLGVDNLNNYYDVNLKKIRLDRLLKTSKVRYIDADITKITSSHLLERSFHPEYVIHLAAQPGVRYSMEHPRVCVDSNINGFLSILELIRETQPITAVYASSSSVYGNSQKVPFLEHDIAQTPKSLYAATKQSNELMAYCYSNYYKQTIVGLRFFSVYGPWGRPDMAPILFSDAIFQGRAIQLYNYGKYKRDYTYIDDIVHGIIGALKIKKNNNEFHRVYNLGNGKAIETLYMLNCLEQYYGRPAKIELMAPLDSEMQETCACITNAAEDLGYKPDTTLEEGLKYLTEWYVNTEWNRGRL